MPLENCIPLDETRLLSSPEQGGLGYKTDDLGYLGFPLVAYGGLRDIDLKPGETIVVAPATGQFGGAAVQMACKCYPSHLFFSYTSMHVSDMSWEQLAPTLTWTWKY